MDYGTLMAESYTGYVFSPACPGTYGFKIIDHEIVLFNGQVPDFFQELLQVAFAVGSHDVYAPLFAEDETKSPQTVFNGIGKFHVCLRAADEDIEVSFFL